MAHLLTPQHIYIYIHIHTYPPCPWTCFHDQRREGAYIISSWFIWMSSKTASFCDWSAIITDMTCKQKWCSLACNNLVFKSNAIVQMLRPKRTTVALQGAATPRCSKIAFGVFCGVESLLVFFVVSRYSTPHNNPAESLFCLSNFKNEWEVLQIMFPLARRHCAHGCCSYDVTKQEGSIFILLVMWSWWALRGTNHLCLLSQQLIHFFRDLKNHDNHKTRLSLHFGAISSLTCTENLEKREKIYWRKFKKNPVEMAPDAAFSAFWGEFLTTLHRKPGEKGKNLLEKIQKNPVFCPLWSSNATWILHTCSCYFSYWWKSNKSLSYWRPTTLVKNRSFYGRLNFYHHWYRQKSVLATA